jgi:hypothetical protein
MLTFALILVALAPIAGGGFTLYMFGGCIGGICFGAFETIGTGFELLLKAVAGMLSNE